MTNIHTLIDNGTEVTLHARGTYGHGETVMISAESEILGRLARITTEGIYIEEKLHGAYLPSILIPFEHIIKIVTP